MDVTGSMSRRYCMLLDIDQTLETPLAQIQDAEQINLSGTSRLHCFACTTAQHKLLLQVCHTCSFTANIQ